jgi:hypothetical protein
MKGENLIENKKYERQIILGYECLLKKLLAYLDYIEKHGVLAEEFKERENWIDYVSWERHLRIMEELRLGLLFLERLEGDKK